MEIFLDPLVLSAGLFFLSRMYNRDGTRSTSLGIGRCRRSRPMSSRSGPGRISPLPIGREKPAWPWGCLLILIPKPTLSGTTTSLPGNSHAGSIAARAAIPRILGLLEKYEIPASFFVPAITAKFHQPQIEAILEEGIHEIGMHGWIHERNSLLSEETERELMQRSYDALKAITGKAPQASVRLPGISVSPRLKLIRELGLLYDSSLMADDRPYEILEYGLPTGVVELPVEWILDDYPYFGFSRYTAVRPHIKPMDVYAIWTAEFDKAYEEGSMFILTMHPKYIGHRSRIAMLEELIKHMNPKEGVWFATHADIARVAQKQLGEN